MWSVYYGDTLIGDPRVDLPIYDKDLTVELNGTGKFEFTLGDGHPMNGKLVKYQKRDEVKVYQDGEMVFCGRVMEAEESFDRSVRYTCEGDRGYLNDAIIEPYTAGAQSVPSTVYGFFNWLVVNYNDSMDPGCRFTVGINQGSQLATEVSRSQISDTKVWTEMKEALVDELGCYVRTRRVGDMRYIDLLVEGDTTSSQRIRFGENLMDFTRRTGGTDYCTRIFARGGNFGDATADMTALNALINQASAIQKGDKSDSAWDSLLGAIVTARFALLDTASTQSQADSAYYALEDAIQKFNDSSEGSSGGSGAVDKTQLSASLTHATGLDRTGLSEKSVSTLLAAIATAQDVMANGSATQSQVNAAQSALDSATNNLRNEGDDTVTLEAMQDRGLLNGYALRGGWVINEAAEKEYGVIEGTFEDKDANDEETLLASALRHLINVKVGDTIEMTALDLHNVDPDVRPIRVGDYVRATSRPHGFDEHFICTSRTYDLDHPENDTFTLGSEYDTLTGSQSKKLAELNAGINSAVDQVDAATALAGSKAAIFSSQPSVYLKNDLWVQAPAGDDEHASYNILVATADSDGTFDASDWERASDYTNDDATLTLAAVYAQYVEAKEAVFDSLSAETAKIEDLTAQQLSATVGYIEDLTTNNVSAQNLTATNGYIETLTSNSVTAQNLTATNGYITNLTSNNVTAQNLTAASGYIADLTADSVTASDLIATNGYIESLTSNDITANDIVADHAEIGDLDANYAQIDLANINNASIKTAMIDDGQITNAKIANGTIENAKIKDATIDTAKIKDAAITTAKIGAAQITTAKIQNAAITNGLIANNAVTNEKVNDLSANKLTAGTIDAYQIDVTNLHASSLIVDKLNGQPVLGGYTYVPKGSTGYSSKNPSTEGWYEMTSNGFALSSDTSVDMTKAYYIDGNATLLYDQDYIDGLEESLNQRIDGAVETFTGDHVPTLNNYPAADWLTDAAKATHVGDIYFVVNSALDQDGYNYRFAYDNSTSSYMWVLIKDSDVTKALGDITNLQSFESTTTSWINTTDQGLTTIRQNHTALSGTVAATARNMFANTVTPTVLNQQFTNTVWNNNKDKWILWNTTTYGSLSKVSGAVRLSYLDASGYSGICIPLVAPNCVVNGETVNLTFTYRTNVTSLGPVYLLYSTGNNVQQFNGATLEGDEEWHEFSKTFTVVRNSYDCVAVLIGYVKAASGKYLEIKDGSAILERGKSFVEFEQTTFKELVDEVDEQSSTITTMSEKVETIASPNLTPWFSMPLTDVYDATTNPNGYWKRITTHAQIPTYVSNQFHNGSGGWAHIVGNVTGSNPYVRFEPMPISLKPSTKYTFMLEIDGTFASTFTNVVWRLAEGSETDAYDLFGSRAEVTSPNSVTSGTYYRTATTNANFSDAITLSRAYVQFYGTGAVDVYARVSVYEGEYSGPYKPYVPISETVTLTNTVNSVKQTADANTASISGLTTTTQTLRTDLDNLEIGGRNLFKDSETISTSSWTYENASNSNGVAEVLTTGSGNHRIYQMPANGYWSWEPGTEYVASIEAKCSGDNGKLQMNPVGAAVTWKEFPLTTEWKRYAYVFTSGSGVTTGSMSFYNNGASGTVVYLRKPKLEKGNMATDWSPAPEDVQGSITTLESRSSKIEQTLDGFSSTVGAIVDESVTGTNILTGNALNPYNWTVSAPDGASYTKTAYGTAGVKVQFSAISGWEWLYSPAITVVSGKKYTLSVEYTVGKDYTIASGKGGFGLSVYKAAPTDTFDSSNANFVARAQFFETQTRVAMKATVTFTATTNSIYLGLNGGQINDSQTGLEFTMDKLTLVENISSRVSTAETSINQTADAIGLTATGTATIANPNLTPFYSMPTDDVWNATTNPKGYWRTITASKTTKLTDGWAHVVMNNASGTGSMYVQVQPAIDVAPVVNGTLLIEIRNFNGTTTAAGNLWYNASATSGTEIPQMVNNSSSMGLGLGNGSYYHKMKPSGNESPDRWARAWFGLSAGFSVEFDARLSFYEGEYTGPYKPYSGSQLYASQAELKVANDNIALRVEKSGVIGAINLSSESATISASKVNIAGAAIFTGSGRLSSTSLNNTYDAKGSAAAVQTNLDNLQVGGTNLIRNGDFSNDKNYWTKGSDTTTSVEDCDFGKCLVTVQASGRGSNDRIYPATGTNFTHVAGETYSISFYAKANATNTLRVDRGMVETETYVAESITTSWKRFEGTCTAVGTGSLSFSLANAGTLYLTKVMLVHGDKPVDWSPDPRDVTARTQRVYYRKNASGAPSVPTAWVTVGNDGTNKYDQWTTKVPPIKSETNRYLYLYTCEQSQKGDGTLVHTTVLLDDSTTVIDGGNIITGSIEANRLSVYDASINKIKAEAIDLTGVQPAGSYATTTALTTETNQRKAQYGTSSTDAATAEKAVTCANFELVAGNELTVKFSKANTSSAAVTLNVNSKGAKNVWVGNAVTSATNQLLWGANAYITFRYDGTQFQVIGEPRTWYGACTTAEGTAAKTDTTAVTGCVVCKGAKVELAMTNANTAASPTLNIQSTGAKAVYFGNGTSRPTKSGGTSWLAANTCTFTFDGAAWRTQGKTYIDANSIVTGYLSADRIEGGTLAIGKLATDLQTKINNAYAGTIEYIVGTHGSTATNVWTGVTRDASISAGKQIAFYMTSAGTSTAATLNLTLSGGGETGAKNVRLNNSNVTTHYAQYTVLKLTYDGTYWKCDNYNSDSTQRTKYEVNLVAAAAITNGHVICGTSSGYRNIAASVSFDLGYPLLYAGTAIAAGATSGTLNNNWLTYQNITYTNNGTITSGAAAKMLFLKGTLTGSSFKISASPFLTTVVPTSDDGLAYIPLGLMSSATAGYFESTKDVYGYRNGSFHKLDTVSNYITADSTGIKIAKASDTSNYQYQTSSGTDIYVSGKKRTSTNANGLEVFDSDGQTSLAKFGTSARIGKASAWRAEVSSNGLDLYGDDNVKSLSLKHFRDTNAGSRGGVLSFAPDTVSDPIGFGIYGGAVASGASVLNVGYNSNTLPSILMQRFVGSDADNTFIGLSVGSKTLTIRSSGISGLASSDIPILTAAHVGSGTLDAARIPSLAASKIGSGTLATARGGTGADGSSVAINKVLASPGSGSAGAVSYRALVAADIPNLNTSKLTAGTLGVARGGTGKTAGTCYMATAIYAFNTTGTDGTVTLTETSANFTFIDIFFKGSDGYYDFTRVYSPNGKTANLSTMESTTSGYLNCKWKAVSISGTSITNKAYAEMDGDSAPVSVNHIKICGVIGYK